MVQQHEHTCPHCGAATGPDFAFCTVCGQELTSPQPQAPPPPRPAAAAPAGASNALHQELRELRELQRRTMERLERLETLLPASEEEPTPAAADERPAAQEAFVFEAAPQPDAIPQPETAPQPETPPQADASPRTPAPPSPAAGKPFAHAPGDRPGQPPRRPQAPRESFESALGRKWLLAVGVVVLVFAVGYFLKYTFAQGWIGPPGQLALSYVFGALLVGGGELTRRKGYAPFGLWVMAGGLATFYAATFAGHRIFELLPQAPTFGILAATTIAAVALALLYNAAGLAVLGLLGGYLTPFLLDGLDAGALFLYSYVTLLNAGVLAASLYRRWTGLNWLGLAATALVFSFVELKAALQFTFFGFESTGFWVSMLFVNLNGLGFSCLPLLAGRLRPGREISAAGLHAAAWLAAGASYLALLLSCSLIEDSFATAWTALPPLFYAGLFAALSLLATPPAKESTAPEPAFAAVLRAHAGVYFVLAAPLALDAQWTTAAWALQGAALVYAGSHSRSRGLNFLGQLTLLLALSRMLVHDYADAWGLVTHAGLAELQGALYTFYGGYAKMLPQRLAVEAAVLLALAFAAWQAGRHSLPLQPPARRTAGADLPAKSRDAGKLMRFACGAGLLIVLSIECAAFFGETAPAARTAAVSALWALFATGLVLYGFRLDRRGARLAALLLYGLTLFKVVLVDMEEFATPYRILSFFILGGLLVGGSFLYHKYKDRLLGEG